MQIPGFQTHTARIPVEGNEPVEVVYLDNHRPSTLPPLLLIHGLFDNKATWSLLIRQLDSRCRIIAPDLIGFGHSSKPLLSGAPEEYRYSARMHVDYLAKFVAGLDLGDLVIGGHSLGGGIALQLYLTRPAIAARIRGLVLAAAAAYPQELPGYVREMGGWLGSLLNLAPVRSLLFRLGLVRYLVRRTFHRTFYDSGKIRDELVDEAIAVLSTPNIFRAYQLAARNIVPADHQALVDRFTRITCPTLVLWGEQDRIIPPLFGLRLEENIPHAELHLFDRCGHAPHLEYPEESAALIEEWLAKKIDNVARRNEKSR